MTYILHAADPETTRLICSGRRAWEHWPDRYVYTDDLVFEDGDFKLISNKERKLSCGLCLMKMLPFTAKLQP